MQDRASYDFSAVPLNKVMRKGKSPGKESQRLREFAPRLSRHDLRLCEYDRDEKTKR
jgi:hypothetical protein